MNLWRRHTRTLWLLQLIAGVSLAFGAPAHAALHEQVVLTSGQGPTRDAAKQNALNYAKEVAISKVARGIDPVKANAYLPKLSAKDIDEMLRGVTILEETRIKDVYYAKVSIAVMDGPIRRAYGENVADDAPNVVGADVTAAPGPASSRVILVVPVFYNGAEPNVWDDKKNPGFTIWQEKSLTVAHGSVLVPNGDPRERAIVDRDNALTASFTDLKPLADTYGSDEVAVVVMTDAQMLPGKKNEIQMTIRRVRESGQRVDQFVVLPKTPTEPRVELYAEAVDQAARILTDAAQATSHIDAKARGAATPMQAVIRFNTLKDWGILQQKLRVHEEFVGMNTQSITLHVAQVTLYVDGKAEAFAQKLKGQGVLVAAPGPAGIWDIKAN